MNEKPPPKKGRTIYRRLSLHNPESEEAARPSWVQRLVAVFNKTGNSHGDEPHSMHDAVVSVATPDKPVDEVRPTTHSAEDATPAAVAVASSKDDAPASQTRTASDASSDVASGASRSTTGDPPKKSTVETSTPSSRNTSTADAAGGTTKVTPATTNESVSFVPTLIVLLIGFVMLLLLIFSLGSFSVRQLRDVSGETLDLQRQRGSQINLLVQMRAALESLNAEARLRSERAARGGIQPFFSNRLSNARNEARELLETFSRTSYAARDEGKAFARELEDFITTTENEADYALRGFEAFARVTKRLESFLQSEIARQDEILTRTENLQRQAEARISQRRWLTFAVGLVIAVLILWDTARRYRRLRLSLDATRRAREFNSQVLEGMVNAIATLDDAKRFRTMNHSFRALFPDTELFASINDFAPAHSDLTRATSSDAPLINQSNGASATEAETNRVLSTVLSKPIRRNEYRGRFEIHDAQPTARTFDAYVAPLQIDDERGSLVSFIDVTEAAEAEATLRRRASLVAVGQASAQIAHEIKNPLGSIRLGVSLLRDMVTEPDAVKTVDLIERGIMHLVKLTADVTEFSSQRELDLSSHNLHDILNDSLELVQDRIREKRINVEKQFASTPLNASADADALRQVFVNLFANAVDASRENSRLQIITSRLASRVRVEIKDEGSGINPEALARLFEPFFTTKQRGTGLGLAITKKIIEQHGGTINVESHLNEGTRVIIELPEVRN